MNIYYNGVDITGDCKTSECVYTDTLGRADTLEISLDNVRSFKKWRPEMNDEIRITHKGIDTGIMYVNAIMPGASVYRMIATAVKADANSRAWRSYRNITLHELLKDCTKEAGMDCGLWGTDGSTRYDYLLRKNETPAGFINRIAMYEGAALKVFNGKFIVTDISKAQELAPALNADLDGLNEGYDYRLISGKKLYGLEIRTKDFSAMAYDQAEAGRNELTLDDVPAANYAEAGRWARGLLLCVNRKADGLKIDGTTNPAFTALARIDVTSTEDEAVSGKWMVQEVTHDLINERSDAELVRVVDTIK